MQRFTVRFPVTGSGKIVGVVDRSDVMHFIIGKYIDNLSAEELALFLLSAYQGGF